MSLFTKIFVVLVMLMSVLLVGLIVPFVVNYDKYKKLYADEMVKRATAEVNYKTREADLNAALSANTDLAAAKDGEIARLQAVVNDKNRQISEKDAEIITLQNSNKDVAINLTSLTASAEINAKTNALLQDEIKARRDKNEDLTKKNIELTEQLNEKTAEATQLTLTVRLQKEELADLNNQYLEISKKLEMTDASPQKGAPGPLERIVGGFSPKHPIRGTVIDVQAIDDLIYVAINVGSNDGVQEGMKFMVHRGDEYLGDVIVNLVDLNSAAGPVVLQKPGVQITPNDTEVQAGGLP